MEGRWTGERAADKVSIKLAIASIQTRSPEIAESFAWVTSHPSFSNLQSKTGSEAGPKRCIKPFHIPAARLFSAFSRESSWRGGRICKAEPMDEAEWKTRRDRIDKRLRACNPPWQQLNEAVAN